MFDSRYDRIMSEALPDPDTLNEIKEALRLDTKLLGEVFRLKEAGVKTALELADKSGASGPGIIYHNLHMLTCLCEGKLPSGAAVSKFTVQAIDRLQRNYDFSDSTLKYFATLKNLLRENAEKISALKLDQQELDEKSEKLSKKAEEFTQAIYVYSYPTYIHFGLIDDPDVMWLKIGSTTSNVWKRVREQSRQTAMPEDPKLLRIYHAPDMNVSEIEQKFHSTLDSVGHLRSANSQNRAGREWFATSLEATDALAKLMNLTIESELDL